MQKSFSLFVYSCRKQRLKKKKRNCGIRVTTPRSEDTHPDKVLGVVVAAQVAQIGGCFSPMSSKVKKHRSAIIFKGLLIKKPSPFRDLPAYIIKDHL